MSDVSIIPLRERIKRLREALNMSVDYLQLMMREHAKIEADPVGVSIYDLKLFRLIDYVEERGGTVHLTITLNGATTEVV